MKYGEHSHAFTIAHSLTCDCLEKIREYCIATVTKGLALDQFKEGLKKHLEQKGYYGGKYDDLPDTEENKKKKEAYLNWRLNVIFKTNINTAYQAGRYRQMLRVSDTRPYWVYSAILDNRTRREHSLLHGKAFRFDDPFWKTNYPPNGWNCRCTVYSITENEAKKDSVDILSSENGLSELGINWKSFCDEEWKYNVGESYFSPDWGKYTYLKSYKIKVNEIKDDGTEIEKETTALKYIKQKWVEDLDRSTLNKTEWKMVIDNLLKDVVITKEGDEKRKTKGYNYVITLKDEIAEKLNIDKRIVIKDEAINHSIRKNKQQTAPQRVLTDDELKQVYDYIKECDYIGIDKYGKYYIMKEIKNNRIVRITLEFPSKNKCLNAVTIEKINKEVLKQYNIVYKK